MAFPSDDALRFVVSRYARLRASFGIVLCDPELIEPSGKHFPDAFALDPEGILKLVRRTMSYAPLADDVEVELGFLEAESESGGGCGGGACAPGEGVKKLSSGAVVELENGSYGIPLRVQDVGDPVVLTASIARAVGAMIVLEAEEPVEESERFAMNELAALSTGLGVLLLNGACVYKKACSGLRAHQATYLDVPELAVATALFCRVHGHNPSTVRRHLETTQAEAWSDAMAWVDSNDEIVAKLRSTPELLADGVFEVENAKGFLGRLFSRRHRRTREMPALAALAAPAKQRSEAELRRRAEMRALVEDALKSS
jgi:hypothetical protein